MIETILTQHGWAVYVSLFVLLLAGAIGLPVPEDIPLVLGGILSQRGHGDTQIILLTCYCGIIIGDLFIYAVGRKLGPALFKKKWFQARLTTERLELIKCEIEKRSLVMIFVARHLFYLRTVTFLTSGAVKMSFRRFLVADAFAALISAPLMVGIGYIGAEHYEEVLATITKVKELSIVLGVIVLAVAVFFYFRRKKKS